MTVNKRPTPFARGNSLQSRHAAETKKMTDSHSSRTLASKLQYHAFEDRSIFLAKNLGSPSRRNRDPTKASVTLGVICLPTVDTHHRSRRIPMCTVRQLTEGDRQWPTHFWKQRDRRII